MQQLPLAPADPNIRALAQRTTETFTGITGATITLEQTPQTTVDGTLLLKLYRNGVLIDPAHGGTTTASGGLTKERFSPLAGSCSITRTGSTATVTTGAGHNLTTGNTVIISGCTDAAYNGTVSIVKTAANKFTYAVGGTPTTPAAGSPHWGALTFTLAGNPPSGQELLFRGSIGGTLQDPSSDYALSGPPAGPKVIALTAVATDSEVFQVVYFGAGSASKGYSLSGQTITFLDALTTDDLVVIEYSYRT